jgi:hypothetical protein
VSEFLGIGIIDLVGVPPARRPEFLRGCCHGCPFVVR